MLLKQERGAALVLVLGIIMLLMIFGTVLSAQATSTQKQLDVTENNIDARNAARMGLEYARIYIVKAYQVYDKEVANKNNNALQNLKDTIQDWKYFARLDNVRSYRIEIIGKPEDRQVKVKVEGKSHDRTVNEDTIITVQVQ